MFKRTLASLLFAALLSITSFMTVFASEPVEETGITPYDSNILTNLEKDVWGYLYTVDAPILLSKDVEITNHYTNPGMITVQKFTLAGAAVGQPILIEPGESDSIEIEPNLLGGQFILRVKADTTGIYQIGISEGNINDDLYTVELPADTWTNVASFNIFSLLGFDITITNNTFSPDDVDIIVLTDDGQLSADDIKPGGYARFPVAGSFEEQDIAVQVKAATAGTYYMNIAGIQ